MSDLTNLQRALRILQRLMTHDRVTIKELRELFENRVSVRTLQRSLNNIQASNIPLRCHTGAHGERFYSLERSFDFVPLALSPDEVLAALLLSGFSDYFRGTRIETDIQRVLAKLDQLLPPNTIAVSSAFHDLSNTFMYHEPGRLRMEARGEILKQVFRAIIEKRVCTVTYGPNAKEFEIHPYCLLLHNSIIYNVVFQPKHQSWIYLSLPRIRKIVVQPERFRRDPNFRLQDFLKDNFGLWSAKPRTVKIRFEKTVVPSLVDRIWHPSQQMKMNKDGSLVLTMQVGLSSELLAWILRWEHFATVQSPIELRRQVKEALVATLRRYK